MTDKPSQSEIDQWRALYAAGGHASHIASQFGRSHHVIRRAIADIKRVPGLPSQTVEKVLELYRSGLGSKRIAKETGIPRTTIRNAIEASGCKVKKPQTAWNKGHRKPKELRKISARRSVNAQSYAWAREKTALRIGDESTHWRNHPEVRRSYLAKHFARPEIRTVRRLRLRLWKVLNVRGYGDRKSAPMLKLIGCSKQQLISHIESKFGRGMSWQNIGDWEIDHIIPCSAFDLSRADEQRKCFHYSNLQPLWRSDNRRKHAKFNPVQMDLEICANA